MRPSFSFLDLMYAQSFLIASVRGIFFPPQIAARLALKFTGAKRPMPFFFAADAAFLAPAFRFFLTCVRFDGGFFVFVVFAIVVFLVAAFLVAVFLAVAVFVVIAMFWSHKPGALSQ